MGDELNATTVKTDKLTSCCGIRGIKHFGIWCYRKRINFGLVY